MKQIRRVLLLAGMSLLGLGGTVPAIASAAPHWKVGGLQIGESKIPISLEGSLTYTYPAAAGGIQWGPCNMSGEGVIWNGPDGGEGEVTNYLVDTPCPTSVPGCNVTNSLTSANPESGVWPVQLASDEYGAVLAHAGDESSPVAFVTIWGPEAACGGWSGAETGFLGTKAGSMNNATSCLEYHEAEGLFVPGIVESGKLNGEECLGTVGGAVTAG